MLLSCSPFVQAMEVKESTAYTQKIKADSQRIFSLREARRSQKGFQKRLHEDEAYAKRLNSTTKDVIAFVEKYPSTQETLDNYVASYMKNSHPDLSSAEYDEIYQSATYQLAEYFKSMLSKQRPASSAIRKPLYLTPCAQCKAKKQMDTAYMQLNLPQQASLQRIINSSVSHATVDDPDMKPAILV